MDVEVNEDDPQVSQNEFIPGYPSFTEYSKTLVSRVMEVSKSANGLPQEGDDYDYYSSFIGYQTFCSKMATRIDRIISKIIQHQQLPCYWGVEEVGGASERPQLEDKFETVIEVNDLLLEKVSVMLDEVAGLRKNIEQPIVVGGVQQGTAEVASWNLKRDAVRKQVGSFKFIHSRNVPRPQVRFQDQVDNSNNPFIPPLKEKTNSRVPLPDVYQKLVNPVNLSALIANAKEWAGSEERLTHPYKFELDNLEHLPEQMEIKEPESPGTLEGTPLTSVDTLAQLEALKKELKSVKEFAIDLEHHSYRSYQGFTCLMQISTRYHDYLIDTLEVRHHMHLLLDPFTDPSIIKVMHGAEFDIHWMQRDFGLYIVNMFDTGQASRVLKLPKFSLSFLLQYCCNVTADKQYQLADWRIRPLPEEMVHYAREDTHYLLYIYDRMRNELSRRGDLDNPHLQDVLQRSRDVCLRQYRKPVFSKTSYLQLYHKHKRRFNSQQLHCLQLLYAWRDHLAREEDESQGYVLPNHMLFQIAEILPREQGGVLACCNPIPILLRQQQQEVFLLVQKARDTPPTDILPLDFGPEKDNTEGALSGYDPLPDHGQTEVRDEVRRLEVFITSPQVKQVKPVESLIHVSQVSLPPDIAKKLSDINNSIPNILNQFQEAKEMTSAEVMVQQRLAYESLAHSAQIKGSPLPDKAPPPSNKDTPLSDKATPPLDMATGSEVRTDVIKGKRKLSMREMGHKESPRGTKVTKKPRPLETTSEDFNPFPYHQSNYGQYTQGSNETLEVYDPHSADGRGKKGDSTPVPSSRVKQKSAQKSYTYTQGRHQHHHHQHQGQGQAYGKKGRQQPKH